MSKFLIKKKRSERVGCHVKFQNVQNGKRQSIITIILMDRTSKLPKISIIKIMFSKVRSSTSWLSTHFFKEKTIIVEIWRCDHLIDFISDHFIKNSYSNSLHQKLPKRFHCYKTLQICFTLKVCHRCGNSYSNTAGQIVKSIFCILNI